MIYCSHVDGTVQDCSNSSALAMLWNSGKFTQTYQTNKDELWGVFCDVQVKSRFHLYKIPLNRTVVSMTNFSSLAATEVIKITIATASSGENFVKTWVGEGGGWQFCQTDISISVYYVILDCVMTMLLRYASGLTTNVDKHIFKWNNRQYEWEHRPGFMFSLHWPFS